MPQTRDWCFTLHFDNEEMAYNLSGRAVSDNFKVDKPGFKYVIYQLERGEDTGRLHWQGFIRFTKHTPYDTVQGYFDEECVHPYNVNPYIKGREGTPDQARNYCLKEETRVVGPFEYGSHNSQGKRNDLDTFALTIRNGAVANQTWKRTAREAFDDAPGTFLRFSKHAREVYDLWDGPEPDIDFQPRPWQRMILELVSTAADRRTIHWVYDPVGATGKSRLGLHLISNHDAIILSGRVNDMAHAYGDARSRVVIFDITRTQADNLKHLYSFAESLKNGFLFSSKYNSRPVTFRPPHVFFFANVKPEDGCWSEDRLNLLDLEANPNLDY